MAETPQPSQSALSALLREEARLLPRLIAVFRLDASAYAEVQNDAQALPAAVVVVVATSILAGLGALSLTGVLLGIAGAILAWGVVAALIWVGCALLGESPPDYTVLLRCLGFAYAWNALRVGSALPLVGPLLDWVALILWAVSLYQATKQVTGLPAQRAIGVCAVGLALPLLLLFLVAG